MCEKCSNRRFRECQGLTEPGESRIVRESHDLAELALHRRKYYGVFGKLLVVQGMADEARKWKYYHVLNILNVPREGTTFYLREILVS